MSLPPDLAERYATIAAAQPQQEAKYAAWIASDEVDEAALTAQAATVGLTVDVPSGHISLGADFEARIAASVAPDVVAMVGAHVDRALESEPEHPNDERAR